MGSGNEDKTTVGSVDKSDSDNDFFPSDIEETKPTRTTDNAGTRTTDDNNEPYNINGEREVKLPQIMYKICSHKLSSYYWNADWSRTRLYLTIGAMFAVEKNLF